MSFVGSSVWHGHGTQQSRAKRVRGSLWRQVTIWTVPQRKASPLKSLSLTSFPLCPRRSHRLANMQMEPFIVRQRNNNDIYCVLWLHSLNYCNLYIQQSGNLFLFSFFSLFFSVISQADCCFWPLRFGMFAPLFYLSCILLTKTMIARNVFFINWTCSARHVVVDTPIYPQ